MDLNTAFAAAAIAVASVGAVAQMNTPSAQQGDPARWYAPADTPAKKYEALAKEAGAALDEARKECRASAADRSACEAKARAQYQDDMRLAKTHLTGLPDPTTVQK